MAKRPETPLIESLDEGEFEELDDLLLSDALPGGCMDVVTLEGFFTAIAIGPVTETPEHWLPHVLCGDRESPLPELIVIKAFKRVVNLISRPYNSVIMIFEIAPEKYSPTGIGAPFPWLSVLYFMFWKGRNRYVVCLKT